MLTQQYHCFDFCLKSHKTRLLFDWQPCQRVNEDWHYNIENAAFTKLETQVFSWHCFFVEDCILHCFKINMCIDRYS